MPVILISVYGWRWPRMRSQPSSCVRKCQSLRCLPWETTSACTLASLKRGAPTFTSLPLPTSSTSRSSLAPTSCESFSTLRRSPSLTRYCFPPVLTTAYILSSVAFRLEKGPAGREIPPLGAERNGDLAGLGPCCQGERLSELWETTPRCRSGFPRVAPRRPARRPAGWDP